MAVDLNIHLPLHLQEITEFKAINEVEGIEAEQLRNACIAARNEFFIATATDYGLKKREQPIKIMAKDNESLDDRRFRLIARYNEQAPFTFPSIEDQIERLCGKVGYVFEYGPEPFHLKVKVALIAKNQFGEVGLTLRKTVPANVVVNLSLLYNQWLTLTTKKWGEMTATTWHNARNEVI